MTRASGGVLAVPTQKRLPISQIGSPARGEKFRETCLPKPQRKERLSFRPIEWDGFPGDLRDDMRYI